MSKLESILIFFYCRKYAERLYTMLRPLTNFEAFYLTDVDVELASRQMKKYDHVLRSTPESRWRHNIAYDLDIVRLFGLELLQTLYSCPQRQIIKIIDFNLHQVPCVVRDKILFSFTTQKELHIKCMKNNGLVVVWIRPYLNSFACINWE